jgi:hypothetical protein
MAAIGQTMGVGGVARGARRGLLDAIAIALVAAVVGTCSSAPAPSSVAPTLTTSGAPSTPSATGAPSLTQREVTPSPGPSASPSGGPPASPGTADDTVRLLAAAGIGVYRSVNDASPILPPQAPLSPFSLTIQQAEELGRELASGGGVTGADLDALADLAPGAPGMSYLVAGWVSGYDSGVARQARTVMGSHDWRHPASIVFPKLVLLLFTSDIATAAAQEPTAAGSIAFEAGSARGPPTVVTAAEGDTVCGQLQGWVSGILTRLFAALKFGETSGPFGILKKIWNLAVDLARGVVVGLIETLGAGVFAIVRTALAVVGVLAFASTLIKDWDITVMPDPIIDRFATPGEPDHAITFTATIDTSKQGKWPAEVIACAKLAGVGALPSTEAPGKPVEWESQSLADIEVAFETGRDSKVRDDSTAQIHFITGRERPEDVNGDEYPGSLLVKVHVKRLTQAELDALFAKIFFGGKAGAILQPLLAGITTNAKAVLLKHLTESGDGLVPISYHIGKETPPPTLPADQACLVGRWEIDHPTFQAYLQGFFGTSAESLPVTGSEQRTYEAGGTFTETFAAFTAGIRSTMDRPVGGPLEVITTMTVNGAGSGTYVAKDGSVAYTGLSENIKATQTISFGGEPGITGPSPITFGVGNGTRTYTCTGDVMIEHWLRYTMAWNRVAP